MARLKKSNEQKPKPDNKRIKQTIGIEDAPTYYANSVELSATPWDYRLRLGELIEASEERRVVKLLATVYMSPQHAKKLVSMWTEAIDHYEKSFGKIPGPKNT